MRPRHRPARRRADHQRSDPHGVLAGARTRCTYPSIAACSLASHICTALSDVEEDVIQCRPCRRAGESVRKLIDYLIDAGAIRAVVAVLHADDDLDVLAPHNVLQVEAP